MSIGLLGKKIGMTRLYDEKGRVTPATVIEAGGNLLRRQRGGQVARRPDPFDPVTAPGHCRVGQRMEVTLPALGEAAIEGRDPPKPGHGA